MGSSHHHHHHSSGLVPRGSHMASMTGGQQMGRGSMGTPKGMNSQFFTIENTQQITLLRTGDEFATGTYYFDTNPVKLTHTWQTNRQLGQPPLLSTFPEADTDAGTLTAQGSRHGTTQMGVNRVSEAIRTRPAQVGFCQPHNDFEASRAGPFAAPKVPADITQGVDKEANGSVRYSYGKQHGENWASHGPAPERYTWDETSFGSGRDTKDGFIHSSTTTTTTEIRLLTKPERKLSWLLPPLSNN